jgi:hypothetical protein
MMSIELGSSGSHAPPLWPERQDNQRHANRDDLKERNDDVDDHSHGFFEAEPKQRPHRSTRPSIPPRASTSAFLSALTKSRPEFLYGSRSTA